MPTAESTSSAVSVEVALHADLLGAGALELLRAAERRNVEFGSRWFALLAKHQFPTSSRWLVLQKGEHCQAVWPLQLGSLAGALSSYYSALYAPAHSAEVSPADLAVLARSLRNGKLSKGVYTFSPMDPQSEEFLAMESALQRAGFVTRRFFRFVNWYLPCKGLTWEKYFAERKGVLRNTVRRMSKKLTADAGSIEIITGGERLDIGLAAYARVYADSWKKAEPYPDFVRELMVLCADNGWLRLGVAWLGDRAIAAQFWIVAHGRAEIFKVAYDEAFKSHTAGTLLTAALMEYVLDRDQVNEVDYLIGDDPYKKTWMSHRRDRWGIVAYNPRTGSGLLGLTRHFAGQLTRRFWPGAERRMAT